MYAVPDVDEVVAVAKELGIHLGVDEAVMYRTYLMEQLGAFDTFVQARLDEPKPPMVSAARKPGYRPNLEEDPLNAWMWKCRIEGAAEGLLAGKTVSYKDHIAVAGIPMSFGSFALEGFIPDFDATVVTRVLKEGGYRHRQERHERTEWRLRHRRRHRRLRPAPQPPQPRSRDRQIVLGLRRGRGRPRGGHLLRRRPRRLNPYPCGFLRHRRTQAHVRIVVALRDRVRLRPEHRLHGSVGPVPWKMRRLRSRPPRGYDPYDPRQTRDVPTSIELLGRLADGMSGLRIGVLEEGFADADAEVDVRDLVMAAVDVLAETGADVSKVSIPEHHTISAAQAAISGEGALAVFKTGFFGAFTRTYYPASLIAAVNKMWASQADVLEPRSKLSLIGAELSRRNYHGRVYAKAQNVRPTYIKAYDAALANVDMLVMPTCTITAPKNHTPGSYLEAVEDNLATRKWSGLHNTVPFNYTGHPALALPVGKSSAGLPVSMQLVGRFFDDPLLMRAAYAYQQSTDWDKIIGVHS